MKREKWSEREKEPKLGNDLLFHLCIIYTFIYHVAVARTQTDDMEKRLRVPLNRIFTICLFLTIIPGI